jgi:stage III sporulation protein AA
MQRSFISRPSIRPSIHRRGVYATSSLETFVPILPNDLRHVALREDIFEVALDLGRPPIFRSLQTKDTVPVITRKITREDLLHVLEFSGPLDVRNRAGVDGTLHRISALLNAKKEIIGLTCRVGRTLPNVAAPLHPVLKTDDSVLIVGKPGSGKTSLLRDISKTLADTYGLRVMIVDKSGEIAGHGDVPHEAIGSARRLYVPYGAAQHDIMIEAVENHTPDVILVDEISTYQEAKACQTIAERGVRLIGTAHGLTYESILKNPTLHQLVGGISTVTLGDAAAKSRGSKKTVRERAGPATFGKIVEIDYFGKYTILDTEAAVDARLISKC